MTTRIKPVILLQIALLFAGRAYCQTPSDLSDFLTRKFKSYCETVPREEIYLHSDRTEYISGEDIWFNIFLTDRQTFGPSLRSRVGYVEILNSENRPVAQKRILIEEGAGPGQIVIPDTLSTGRYIIRAYTGWMKNFLPANCFIKQITIYNALSPKGIAGNINVIHFSDKVPANGVSQKKADSGAELSVSNSKSDILEIAVKSNNRYRLENNDLFYLFIQTHGNINLVSREKITGETTIITFPRSLLIAGINQITIFNAAGKPVDEKYIYTPLVNPDQPAVQTGDSYKIRDKIVVDIGPGKEVSAGVNGGNLSVSVAPLAGGQDILGIEDWLVFGTEFGPLPLNSLKGRKMSEIPADEMNNILSNITTSWTDWREILSATGPKIRFHAENESHFINGRFLTGEQQPAREGNLLFLCAPGKKSDFQYARTDKEGNFSFSIHVDEALKDLVIIPDEVIKNQRIIIESSYSDKFLQTETRADAALKELPSYVPKWSLNYQVGKIYRVSSKGKPSGPEIPPLRPVRFYGIPDYEIRLADYIKLPVMEEVILELLPHVSLRKKNSTYEITISERIDNNFYVYLPVLMIDGVIIKDASLIVNLDPEAVERIDVIKGKYLVGKYLFPGIVNVITKSGDFSSVAFPDYMIRLAYRVVDPVPSFSSPDYSSEEMRKSRIPDYRNTLYWNPSIKPGSDGKARIEFWSSDNKSDYLITVQGTGSDGKPFSTRKIIRVK